MNVFLLFRRSLVTLCRRVDYTYDGWMHFSGFKISTPIYKSWIFFKYISDPVRLKEDSHKHLRWPEGERIFHFWPHCPFKDPESPSLYRKGGVNIQPVQKEK